MRLGLLNTRPAESLSHSPTHFNNNNNNNNNNSNDDDYYSPAGG
jgi:hypothetical protein